MNSFSLFSSRLRQNWTHQLKVIKSVADWTVILYFIIPASVISIAVYRSWWMETPAWIQGLPFSLLYALFFFTLWGGHFRTFVREADRIFLIKNEKLMTGMKRWGIGYSYLSQLFSSLSVAAVIAPFWLNHYGFSPGNLAVMVLLWLSLKWMIMGIAGRLNVEDRGWKMMIKRIPIFLLAGLIWLLSYSVLFAERSIYALILFIAMAAASFAMVWPRVLSVRTFEQDLAIDEKEKNSYTEMILGASFEIEKMKPASTRKKPLLFTRSNRIFQKRTPLNGFLELFMKVAARNIGYILSYMQITGITSFAVGMLPALWLKIGVALAGILFLLSWSGLVWHKLIEDHPFTKKYAGEDAFFQGKKLVATILVIPYGVLVGSSFFISILLKDLFPFF